MKLYSKKRYCAIVSNFLATYDKLDFSMVVKSSNATKRRLFDITVNLNS